MGSPVQPGQIEPLLEEAVRMGQQNAIYFFRFARSQAAIVRGELSFAERSTRESVGFSDSFSYRFTNHLHLATIYDFQGRDDEMLDSLRRAIEDEPHSFMSGLSQAAHFRARAIRGDAGSIGLLSHSSVSMPVPGKRNRLGAWWAMVCAVPGLAALGRLEDAAAQRQSTEEFLLTGTEFGLPFLSARTAAGIAAACAREWSRAEEHHRAAIHDADTAPARIFQPVSREWYAAMLAARGDVDRARSMLAEALAVYETIGMPGYARRASERLAAMAR